MRCLACAACGAHIETGFGIEFGKHQRQYPQCVATIPAGRIGDPAEFGTACACLCSSQAGYITGQNWLLDGGAYPGTY